MASALSRSPAEILLRIPLTGDGGGVAAAPVAGAGDGAGVAGFGAAALVVSRRARVVSTAAGACVVSAPTRARAVSAAARALSWVAGGAGAAAGGGAGVCARARTEERARTAAQAAAAGLWGAVVQRLREGDVRGGLRAHPCRPVRLSLRGQDWRGFSVGDLPPPPARRSTSSITGSRPAP